jgi:GNAT superfamily N-acetyltransferase
MESSVNILPATNDAELHLCWPLVQELRPHLTQNEFVKSVGEMMPEGYTPVFIKEEEEIVAYAGYRETQMLFCGKIIYIDDLVTAPDKRGKGYASYLLEYIFEIAKSKQLNGVHLDSGYLKTDAHRLYLNKGFKLLAHHFGMKLEFDR